MTENYENAMDVLCLGESNRHYASTALNHNSSRSHTLFRIFLEYIDRDGNGYSSVCNIVDLAGSEKASKFDADEKDIQ